MLWLFMKSHFSSTSLVFIFFVVHLGLFAGLGFLVVLVLVSFLFLFLFFS